MGAKHPQEDDPQERGWPVPDGAGHRDGPTAARLRDAVVELVGSAGIEALSDEALTARAGVSPIALQRRFGDAEGCLVAAYSALLDELFGLWQDAFAEVDDFDQAVVSSSLRVLGWMAQRPSAARVICYEVLRGGHELRSRRDAGRLRVVTFLVDEHARRGAIALPATQLELLSGALSQAFAGWVAEGRAGEGGALEPEILDVMAVFEPAVAA